MCVEGIVTPRQRRWRRGRAFCQRASPSPFSLEDPADTADSYACWTGENADEAAVGWTERVRQLRTPLKEASNAPARPEAQHSSRAIERPESTCCGRSRPRFWTLQLGGPLPFPGDFGRQVSRPILPSMPSQGDSSITRVLAATASDSAYCRDLHHQRIFAPRTANLDLSADRDGSRLTDGSAIDYKEQRV